MSIDRFLDQVNALFDQETSRTLIRAFRHERLVWKTLESKSFQEAFLDFAKTDLTKWQPSVMALFSINPDLATLDFKNPETKVPETLKSRAHKLLETVRLTGLEPSLLSDAGLLALTLRNLRVSNKSWRGLVDFIATPRNNLRIWSAAFACLPGLISDFSDIVKELLTSTPKDLVFDTSELIIHAIACTPSNSEERFQKFLDTFANASKDFQVASLNILKHKEEPSFLQQLAAGFLSQKVHQTETAESAHVLISGERKPTTSFIQVEDLQKTAYIHQIAGQAPHAQKTIDLAFQQFNLNQALIMRGLALELENTEPEEARKNWEKVLELAPEDQNFKLEYADFLLKIGEEDYGLELIKDIPSSDMKSVFSLRHPSLKTKDELTSQDLENLFNKQTNSSDFRTDPLEQTDYLKASEYAFNIKNYQLADDFIRKVLAQTPNDLDAIKLSGKIHQRMADVDKAIESATLVAMFEPQNIKNKKELAGLYLQTQQPERALNIYQEIIQSHTEPSRRNLLTYSEIAIKANKPEIAIPICENFLSHDNLDGEALVILCNAQIAKGNEEVAIALLEQASTLAPEKPSSWLSLAQIWTRLGNKERALESLEKAKVALPENSEILSALGLVYLENGKVTEAISVLKQAFLLDPNDHQIRKSLAKAYLSHGYLNEAWSVVGPMEKDYASDPELALIIGKVLVAMGDHNASLPILQFAWNSCRSNEALKAYTELLLMHKQLHGNLTGSGLKDLDLISKVLQERITAESENFELRMLEADVRSALGNLEEAYKAYLLLLDEPEAKSPRRYHHLQLQIGRTALMLDMKDISLASLQEAVLVFPEDIDTRHILAEAFIVSGFKEEGLSAARSSLQLAPSDIENIIWFSNFAARNQSEKESIQVLKDAIHLQPEERALYLTLARVYASSGQLQETKDTLNKMLASENITTEEYVNVANIYLHMGEPDEASSIISKAIAQNPAPDFEETRDLAYSAMRLGDASAAKQLLEELETQIGSHPAYPILKSDVLAANKQFIPALQCLENLINQVEFSPEHFSPEISSFSDQSHAIEQYSRAGVFYRAAQLERVIGDLTSAQKHIKLALTIEPINLAFLLLQSELAFATGITAKLDTLLDHIKNLEINQPKVQEITHLLAVNAILEQNSKKIELLTEHFLSKESLSPVLCAINTFSAYRAKNQSEATKHLLSGMQLIEENSSRIEAKSFNISDHFSQIWQYLALGLAAWECEDWNLTNQCFQKALADVKINPVVNRLLAEFLVEKNRMAKIFRFLHVVNHFPENFDPEETDKSIHEEQISLAGRFINAAAMIPTLKIGQAVFNEQWENPGEISQYIKTGQQAAQAISVAENSDIFKEVQNAFADNFDVSFQKTILLLQKNSKSAKESIEVLLEERPDNPLLLYMLAEAKREDPVESAELIEKALSIWSDEPDWHATAGLRFEQAELYENAARHLEEAIRISPKNAEYWQMLGDIKVLEKDYHAAKDYFGKAIDLFPDDPEALSSLAIINQRLGEHQIAIQCLMNAEKLDPGNPRYGEAIAQSFLAKQDYQSAIDQANKVLEAHPESSPALQTKVKALIAKKQYEEARRVIKAASSIIPNSIPFDILSIKMEVINNKYSGLNASLMLAEAHPEDVEVLNNLSIYYLEAGMQTQAENTLHQSLAIDPTNPETLLMLGRIDRKRGNLDQALSHLSQSLKADPSLVEAYLELGQTYQDRREINNALETYHKAIKMVEKDPRAYIQASMAYKESKDYRNAEYMLRQAAQISPTDPTIRRQLAAIVAMNLVNNLQEVPKRR